MVAVAQTTHRSGASICDGTTHDQGGRRWPAVGREPRQCDESRYVSHQLGSKAFRTPLCNSLHARKQRRPRSRLAVGPECCCSSNSALRSGRRAAPRLASMRQRGCDDRCVGIAAEIRSNHHSAVAGEGVVISTGSSELLGSLLERAVFALPGPSASLSGVLRPRLCSRVGLSL
jgi:hypothetical protein